MSLVAPPLTHGRVAGDGVLAPPKVREGSRSQQGLQAPPPRRLEAHPPPDRPLGTS